MNTLELDSDPLQGKKLHWSVTSSDDTASLIKMTLNEWDTFNQKWVESISQVCRNTPESILKTFESIERRAIAKYRNLQPVEKYVEMLNARLQ